MGFRIFNIDNIVKIVDLTTFEVTERSRGDFWWGFNNLAAPITYSIYQKQPEKPLILNKEYTEFRKEDNSLFDNDTELLIYLRKVFSVPPTEDNLQTIQRGEDFYLNTYDEASSVVLNDILYELKKMNVQLALITGDEIKRI